MLIPLQFKLIALAMIVSATFAYGYKKGTDKGEAEIQRVANEAQSLQLALEQEQHNIKEKIVTEYVDKVKTVKEKEYVYVEQAKNAVPAQYNLSNGWVYIHNHSTGAEAGVSDPTRAADGSSSGIKDNEALLTIISNYSACLQNAQQIGRAHV